MTIKKLLLWTLPLVLLSIENTKAARILALFPAPAKSHFIGVQNLLEELVKRGHQLTVISAFPREKPLPNYKDISYENFFLSGPDMQKNNVFQHKGTHPIQLVLRLRPKTRDMCEKFLKYPSIQAFLQDKSLQFDLVIYEPFFMECTYGILNKFRVPTIHISSNTIAQWMGDGVGNPYFYSYMPELLSGYTDKMNFWERFDNAITETVFELYRHFIHLPAMHEIATRVLNDINIPSLREIETNASLLLLNSNRALNYPRPLTPNTIEVGGMHIKPVQKLPSNLQKMLDEATNGVIYFSLGSFARGSQMPQQSLEAFVKGFSRIKETVLWKFDLDTIPNLPKNVHLGKWFPQNDILAHPNLKAFISHGGLLSTEEATYLGMPLITVPITADQKTNAKKGVKQGYAIQLDFSTLTDDILVNAINEITTNPQFREKAKLLSKIFKDQPENPLDRAIFWTEYIIRHNGAPHLRSASLDLNIFEYLLLDVLAVISVFCLMSVAILVVTCRALYRYFFTSKKIKLVADHPCEYSHYRKPGLLCTTGGYFAPKTKKVATQHDSKPMNCKRTVLSLSDR